MNAPILSSAVCGRLLQPALQADLSTFVGFAFKAVNPNEAYHPNWHIDALCHELAKVYRGETQRLLITMPPRYLKSLCISIAFPAWAMGKDPSLKFIVASYGNVLAKQHAKDFKRVIDAPFFRSVFPTHGKATQHTADLYLTAKNGSRRAVSVEGGVTGLGADIIIVDDLLKAADANSPTERQKAQDFYVNTLISRLNDKNTGRIIVVQQRLHEEDLAGYLIAKGGFKHLNLPAIAETAQTYDLGVYGVKARETGELLFEARESQAILDQVRAEMGRGAFAAQYQQNPQASDDQIIRWDKLHFYQGDVPRTECIYLVQSWDTATSDAPTANFSVCTTWGHHQGVWKLLDVYRERLNFTDLVSKAVALRDKWRPDRVLIEDASSGRALLQTLRSEKYRGACSTASVVVTSMTPSLSKETRLSAGALLLEDGRVQLPIDAPWLEVLRRELLAFPGGKLDDQVDSVSQFLKYAAGPRSNARLDRARGHTR